MKIQVRSDLHQGFDLVDQSLTNLIMDLRCLSEMNSDFKRGIKIGLYIYGIGIVLTVVVHLVFGWDYPHGPPTSAIPLFFTFVVGGLRLLFTVLMTMAEKSQQAKGELIVHLGVGVIILVFLAWLRHMAIG